MPETAIELHDAKIGGGVYRPSVERSCLSLPPNYDIISHSIRTCIFCISLIYISSMSSIHPHP